MASHCSSCVSNNNDTSRGGREAILEPWTTAAATKTLKVMWCSLRDVCLCVSSWEKEERVQTFPCLAHQILEITREITERTLKEHSRDHSRDHWKNTHIHSSPAPFVLFLEINKFQKANRNHSDTRYTYTSWHISHDNKHTGRTKGIWWKGYIK